MGENTNIYKEIRSQLLGGYEKPNYEIDKTVSWPVGLDEASRFSPYLRRTVRRSDSADDIQRYYRYFSLARKNQGHQFTWKYYCNILLDHLLNSDILDSLNKLSIQPSCTSVQSNRSNVPTVFRSVSSMRKVFEKRAPKKRSFLDMNSGVDSSSSLEDVRFFAIPKNVTKLSSQTSAIPTKSDASKCRNAGPVPSMRRLFENHTPKKRSFLDIEADIESMSSLDDLRSISPSKNVLKKMCTEIRTLTQKTCKKIEKMTTPTINCSLCGNVIRSTVTHKKCSKQCKGKSDYNKPLTTSNLGATNSFKSQPMSFQSPSITPVNVVDPRIKKLQRKPLFKM